MDSTTKKTLSTILVDKDRIRELISRRISHDIRKIVRKLSISESPMDLKYQEDIIKNIDEKDSHSIESTSCVDANLQGEGLKAQHPLDAEVMTIITKVEQGIDIEEVNQEAITEGYQLAFGNS